MLSFITGSLLFNPTGKVFNCMGGSSLCATVFVDGFEHAKNFVRSWWLNMTSYQDSGLSIAAAIAEYP